MALPPNSLMPRALRFGLSGLAVLLPLFFLTNFNDTFDLPKLGLVYISVAFFLPWIYFQISKTPSRPLFYTGAEGLLLVLFVALAVSAFYSIDRDISWNGFYRIYVFGLLPITAFLLLFWISAQEDAADMLTRWIMIGGAVAGLYGLLQVCGIEPFSAMPRVRGFRPWSSLGNPIYLGAVCMMALTLTLGEFNRRKNDRGLIVALGCSQAAGLLLSLSRSAWVGTVVGILYLSWAQKRKRMLEFTGAFVLISLLFLPAVRERATELFSRSEVSNASRVEGWKGALQVWRAAPFLGSGPDTFFEAFRARRTLAYIRATSTSVTQGHAHNDFLQMAATTGLLGVSAFTALIVVLGLKAWRKSRENPLTAAPLAAACVALLVQDQFNFSSVTTTAWAALLLGQLARDPKKFITFPHQSTPVRAGVGLGMILMGFLFAWTWIGSWVADDAFKEAQALRQSGKPIGALVLFRESIRWRPAIETYQTELGNTARALAETAPAGSLRTALFVEAWNAAKTNTERHAFDPDAWNNLGVVAMWRAQLNAEPTMKAAREAFNRAVELDPLFVDAWANLAKWRHLNGDIPGEKELWRKVLQIDPQHEMARAVLAQPS